jgi:hypothetical protein
MFADLGGLLCSKVETWQARSANSCVSRLYITKPVVTNKNLF